MSPASPPAAIDWKRLERLVVWAFTAHTLVIGVMLVFFTRFGLDFGGYPPHASLFFPRQGGAFHFVVGAGYLIEYRRHGTVTLMVLAKCLATVFLLGESIADTVPWVVPVSGITDGAMAAIVAWVHARAVRSTIAAP